MKFLSAPGARTLRGSSIAAVVLVGGLVAPQSSATPMAVRSETTGTVIDVSPSNRPIPVVASVAMAAELVEAQVVTSTGTRLFRISADAQHDLPKAAKRAYERAARRIEQTNPGCDLPWGLLAAIGRIESDHGRYDGARLGVDGVSRPLIRGIALNGIGPVAAIPDTDNGRLDGDKIWDRAVGPMQFIPTTWAFAGVDGDRDGVANPDDLDDAALAAAGYLCPPSGPIGDEAAMRRAVFAYNHSDYYVDLVLAFAIGYHTGVFNIPPPPVVVDPEVDAVTDVVDANPTDPSETQAPSVAKPPQPTKPPKTPEAPEPTKPPNPPKTPEPTPEPSPTPEPLALKSGSGAWSACGGGWCLAGYNLDLGSAAQLGARAAEDFDGDGAVETNQAEFDGLVGRSVTIQAERGTAVVYTIEGLGYRNADGGFAAPA